MRGSGVRVRGGKPAPPPTAANCRQLRAQCALCPARCRYTRAAEGDLRDDSGRWRRRGGAAGARHVWHHQVLCALRRLQVPHLRRQARQDQGRQAGARANRGAPGVRDPAGALSGSLAARHDWLVARCAQSAGRQRSRARRRGARVGVCACLLPGHHACLPWRLGAKRCPTLTPLAALSAIKEHAAALCRRTVAVPPLLPRAPHRST